MNDMLELIPLQLSVTRAMEGMKELFESSSIHGVAHILSEKKLFKLLWIIVVFSGFIGAGVIIRQSFQGWEDSPISTTIETRPISSLSFPEVVVCPARNSFTTLSPELLRTENQTLDDETKQKMLDVLLNATFDLRSDEKFREMTRLYEKDKFLNWYRGYSEIKYPTEDGIKRFYRISTSAPSGSFSTPFFGESFNEEDFLLELSVQVSIYVPTALRSNRSISLVIEIDYDIEENEMTRLSEDVKVYSSNTKFSEYEQLNANFTKYKKEFPLQGDRYYNLVYSRRMSESEYQLWTSKRHKGMRATWHYNETVQPDQKYMSENKEFIQLVHVLFDNQSEVFERLKEERHNSLNIYHECHHGKLSGVTGEVQLPSFDNTSTEPLSENVISEDILNTAGWFYFYFTHCPDDNIDMRDFYKELFDKFSMRTILTTLARFYLTSLETGSEKLMSSRVILEEILKVPGISVKDYIQLTTKLSDLEKRKSLINLILKDNVQGKG